MVTKPRGGGKGESYADQLLWKVLKYLKYCCADVYIMGYSWECGRLLLRICHNDFWFCGILTDRLVSKIFWRHWLYERSRTFAWFSQKLQWFNKNTHLVFIPSEIYIQRVKRYLSKKMKSDWREVLSVDYFNSINC